MRDRHGFILVYDITNPSSMDDLHDLYQQILRNKLTGGSSSTPAVPLVLVGNKLDLAPDRKVPCYRGKELSVHWKCPHYEASAKTRANVDEVFYDLVRQMARLREEATHPHALPGGFLEKDDSDSELMGTGCCTIS
jgi:GTPase SAR1 family protein